MNANHAFGAEEAPEKGTDGYEGMWYFIRL